MPLICIKVAGSLVKLSTVSKRFAEIVSYELHETTCESNNALLHLQTLLPRPISRMQKRPPHQYH